MGEKPVILAAYPRIERRCDLGKCPAAKFNISQLEADRKARGIVEKGESMIGSGLERGSVKPGDLKINSEVLEMPRKVGTRCVVKNPVFVESLERRLRTGAW